jgi:tetratricopeptide (TPR) repeat protein
MLIKLVAHTWEGKGDSHRCQRENLKPEQERLQKEKEGLEHQLAEIKRRQKQEDTTQEQKSLEQEQETLEHKLADQKQKLEDLKQMAESQADRSFKAYRQAVECLDKLTLDSDAMSSRGYVLSKMMRHGEALDSYDTAIKNSSSWPKELAGILRAKALIGRGNVLFETGKHEEALRCYKDAMEAFPGCKPCLMGKCSDLEKIAGGEKGPARDEAAAILQKIKETGQVKQEETLGKAARERICSEAWQDREMYLSLMRYSN